MNPPETVGDGVVGGAGVGGFVDARVGGAVGSEVGVVVSGALSVNGVSVSAVATLLAVSVNVIVHV